MSNNAACLDHSVICFGHHEIHLSAIHYILLAWNNSRVKIMSTMAALEQCDRLHNISFQAVVYISFFSLSGVCQNIQSSLHTLWGNPISQELEIPIVCSIYLDGPVTLKITNPLRWYMSQDWKFQVSALNVLNLVVG